MKISFIVAAITLSTITVFSATAQNNRGLRDENMRIRQGVVSGQLTTLEAARLQTQKNDLRREAVRYKTNDGRIGPLERADLRRDNRQLNRNIVRQKHDRQRRF